jgi:hypothetical protein
VGQVGICGYGAEMSTSPPRPKARGLLFAVLALGLLGIGVAAFHGGVWVIGLAAAVLGLWMADLASRDLGLRGRR